MNTTQRNSWDNLSLREKSEMMKVAVQNGIYSLDDIRQAYNEYAEGGSIYDGTTETTQQMNTSPRPITTGGAGYIPPVATNVQQIVDKAKGLGRYTIGYIKNKFGFPTPYIIDLSNEDVVQVTPDTDESQLQTILTNDFVEDKTRGYRLAKDFKNTNDTIIGDRFQIPLSKISTYYGVEDGKLKAGPLDIFNDSTTVVPNRAKYVGRIKEFHEGDEEARKELDKVVTKDIKNYNEEHGYRPTFSEQLLYHTGFPFIFQPHPAKILRNRVGYDESVRLIKGFVENHQDLREKMRPWVVTENNDTIRGVEFNGYPKILFGNEKGEGLFVSDPEANLDSLNSWLGQHPSYPVMVDNGRYSDFQLSDPSLDSYAGVGEKDNLFVIGTKKKALGGPIIHLANRYEDGGNTNGETNIIDWIIGEEGFNIKPEDIGDGVLTLGSGLTSPKWHRIYREKGVWSKEDNRKAVAEEVENRRRWASKNVPNWNELPEDSQNALLSYKYNFDFTRDNSPLLFKALEDKDYEEAARQIDATSSNPKFKKGLQARRQREQELFMRGINSMDTPQPEAVKPVAATEELVYTPPQRVIDNISANNGRYMITGTPPLAGPRNTVLNALRRLKELNLFAGGGPLVDLANSNHFF